MKDQCTVSEVNIARLHNHNVELRKKRREISNTHEATWHPRNVFCLKIKMFGTFKLLRILYSSVNLGLLFTPALGHILYNTHTYTYIHAHNTQRERDYYFTPSHKHTLSSGLMVAFAYTLSESSKSATIASSSSSSFFFFKTTEKAKKKKKKK